MALAAKRTAAAGGADATVTSAAALFAVIDSLLTTAGWTVDFDYMTGPPPAWQNSTTLPLFNSNYTVGDLVTNSSNIYQCITSGTASTNPTGPTAEGQAIADGTVVWRFITSSAGHAKVYKSTGESGAEVLWTRVVANTNATPAINITQFQYFDPTAKFGFNKIDFAGDASTSLHQYTYTGGNTVNYAMVADKNSYMIFTNDNANNRRVYGGGRLDRAQGVNATTFAADAQVNAGLNKTITVASGDPVAAGYAIGDRVFVVAQEANSGSPFNGTIPLYAAVITAVTTTTITIDNAQETTATGALIGADPQPLFTVTTAVNTDLSNNSVVASAYIWNNTVPNIRSAAPTVGQGYLNTATPMLGLIGSAPAEQDPNNRTNRVGTGELLVASLSNEIIGILPKYYSNPRTSDALWAIARTTKEATPRDYVVFPANTASPSGQRRSLVGPFATSGSATFQSDLFRQDSNVWIEAPLSPFVDKFQKNATFWTGAQRTVGDPNEVPMIIGQLFTDNDTGTLPDKLAFNDVMPQGELYVNSVADKTIEGQGSPLRTGGELYPFDTSNLTSGGRRGGFNPGFN